MRTAIAMTGAAILFGSAATLALQNPVVAQQTANPPQNAAPAVQGAVPGSTPFSFADLAARLQPAVVNISTTQEIEVSRGGSGFPPGFGEGTPFEELFRRFQRQPEGEEPITREATSLGSGFVISPDGYIVTNNHVVAARGGDNETIESITVTFPDGEEFEARVVGRDALTDVALLKIDGGDLPYVRFGSSSSVRVGDWVLAIGNPFQLGGSVTAGIVSALGRPLPFSQYDRFIQTDAAINQGNSGGPMFDLQGNVIGMNTAIYSPTGGNVGIGFAIPSEQVEQVVEQLRTIGRVRRGYLGVAIQPLTDELAAGLGLPEGQGEIIASVTPDGPADQAGIQRGDVIVEIAGQPVTEDNTLSLIVANSPIGSEVDITLVRDGERRQVEATLDERPSEEELAGTLDAEGDLPADEESRSEAARSSLGITLTPLTPQLRRQLSVEDDVEGVVIADLDPNSDAARKGLRPGALIMSINGTPTATPQAAAKAVDAARQAGRNTVAMLVKLGNTPPRFIGIEMMAPDQDEE